MKRRGQRLAVALGLWILALVCAAPFGPLFAAAPLKACCRTKAHRKCCCRTAKPGDLALTAAGSCARQCGVSVGSTLLGAAILPAPAHCSASLVAVADLTPSAVRPASLAVPFAQFGRPPPSV